MAIFFVWCTVHLKSEMKNLEVLAQKIIFIFWFWILSWPFRFSILFYRYEIHDKWNLEKVIIKTINLFIKMISPWNFGLISSFVKFIIYKVEMYDCLTKKTIVYGKQLCVTLVVEYISISNVIVLPFNISSRTLIFRLTSWVLIYWVKSKKLYPIFLYAITPVSKYVINHFHIVPS